MENTPPQRKMKMKDAMTRQKLLFLFLFLLELVCSFVLLIDAHEGNRNQNYAIWIEIGREPLKNRYFLGKIKQNLIVCTISDHFFIYRDKLRRQTPRNYKLQNTIFAIRDRQTPALSRKTHPASTLRALRTPSPTTSQSYYHSLIRNLPPIPPEELPWHLSQWLDLVARSVPRALLRGPCARWRGLRLSHERGGLLGGAASGAYRPSTQSPMSTSSR